MVMCLCVGVWMCMYACVCVCAASGAALVAGWRNGNAHVWVVSPVELDSIWAHDLTPFNPADETSDSIRIVSCLALPPHMLSEKPSAHTDNTEHNMCENL